MGEMMTPVLVFVYNFVKTETVVHLHVDKESDEYTGCKLDMMLTFSLSSKLKL